MMRLFVAAMAMAFLGFRYYTTQDYVPLAVFIVLYTAYELASRVNRLGIFRPVISFTLSVVFLQALLDYLNIRPDIFVFLLSAGISLAFSTSGLRYHGYLAVLGSGLIAVSILLIPDGIFISAYRLPAFLAVTALTITSLLPLLSERFEFIISERIAILLIVLVAGIYYTSLRNSLMPGLRNLGDWILVSVSLIYFLGKLRLEVQEEVETKDITHDFDSLAKRAEREYIEGGNPVPLAVFITYNLAKAGVDIKYAERILSSVIEGEKLPKYAFSFENEIIQKRRRKNRLKRIAELKRRVEKIGDEYGN